MNNDSKNIYADGKDEKCIWTETALGNLLVLCSNRLQIKSTGLI